MPGNEQHQLLTTSIARHETNRWEVFRRRDKLSLHGANLTHVSALFSILLSTVVGRHVCQVNGAKWSESDVAGRLHILPLQTRPPDYNTCCVVRCCVLWTGGHVAERKDVKESSIRSTYAQRVPLPSTSCWKRGHNTCPNMSTKASNKRLKEGHTVSVCYRHHKKHTMNVTAIRKTTTPSRSWCVLVGDGSVERIATSGAEERMILFSWKLRRPRC